MWLLKLQERFETGRVRCRFQGDRAPGIFGEPDTREEGESAGVGGYDIFCAACNFRITDFESVIEVNGHHEHRFVNPAGTSFHIGCFASAKGCRAEGIPTPEFTWFPGYSWAYSVCASCRVHLGWHYSSAVAAGFFGLILARLVWAKSG